MLEIYNTLTRNKMVFKPIKPGEVSLYVCGLTVYNFCHIGNARVFVVFDVIVRFLHFLGYKVNYVRNITDIDDKIINKANKEGVDFKVITKKFIQAMHEDAAMLNLLPPTVEPKATKHIAQIITFIKNLLTKEFAYQADNGDVYFAVNKFEKYGELAQQDLDELQSGARVEVSSVKRSPFDFVLWKSSKENEPAWESPWGKGRPGWHIECSVMANEYLGQQFDMHGGGMDLQFPHHQNELAQSEAANGCQPANYWIHLGYVQVDNKKMSKSHGNFFTLREVLKEYNYEVIRYFLIASHYRSPVNYSIANLNGAKQALERFYLALRDLPDGTVLKDSKFETQFVTAMNDDFNTPEAIAVLFNMTREINRLCAENKLQQAADVAATQIKLAEILGLLQQKPNKFLHGGVDIAVKTKIEQLIAERNSARSAKDWSKADAIRAELTALGVEIEDTPEGTIWRHIS